MSCRAFDRAQAWSELTERQRETVSVLARELGESGLITDRRHHLAIHHQCFVCITCACSLHALRRPCRLPARSWIGWSRRNGQKIAPRPPDLASCSSSATSSIPSTRTLSLRIDMFSFGLSGHSPPNHNLRSSLFRLMANNTLFAGPSITTLIQAVHRIALRLIRTHVVAVQRCITAHSPRLAASAQRQADATAQVLRAGSRTSTCSVLLLQ